MRESAPIKVRKVIQSKPLPSLVLTNFLEKPKPKDQRGREVFRPRKLKITDRASVTVYSENPVIQPFI